MGAFQVQRVALLNSGRRWIGEAAHTLMLAEGLRARGVEVVVVVRRGHDLERRAREAGLDVASLDFSSRFSLFGDMRDRRTLRRLLRERRIQVVHTHRGKDHWLAAWALIGLRPRPALVRTRHVVTPMRPHLFNRWLMRRATDRVIAVSDVARQSLAGVLTPEQIAATPVIHSAVDLEAFHPSRRDEALRRNLLGLRGGELAVGLLGRLQNVKGQRVLLEAAAMLAREQLPARFILAGTERTPGRAEALRALAQERGIADRVTILTDLLDVAAFLASLDVSVIASIGSEGSSRVAYESMACGVPLVATTVGVLPEVVRDGENGLLVAPRDAKGLADAIRRLLTSPDLRARLASGGRNHAEAHHAPDAWLDAVQRVYDEAAAVKA